MNAEGLVKNATECSECHEDITFEVKAAYRWLYGGHKLDVDTFAKELRKAVYEGRGFECDGVDDEAVGEAFEYATGHSSKALVEAVLHRRWEDGP